MQYLDEYRHPHAVKTLVTKIHREITGKWVIMEVCGGQTHSILKYGLDQLLPPGIELIHGPGCPVCITPIAKIDAAIAIAQTPGVLFCSYGDMLRVPGSSIDLMTARSRGADVRIVHSPMDAVALARAHPLREVVFFAVGFETTAPANAMAAFTAHQAGLNNFSMVVSHALVPPALLAILNAPNNRVQAILAAGHVCAITGYEAYQAIAESYRVPIVVTGFEPTDILQGILLCARQLESGRAEVENQYARVVRKGGNLEANALTYTVFMQATAQWRGLGDLAASGLVFTEAYRTFDAEEKFGIQPRVEQHPTDCLAGLVMTGQIKPHQCPAFAATCSPEHPLGAPMVSTEGACAAYHSYRQRTKGPIHEAH